MLGSLRFALVVVALIAAACIAGTVIPQGEQVGRYLMTHPGPHPGLNLLIAVGLTNVFHAWWFAVLLCVLAASLLVCTGRRYGAIRRSTGGMKMRVIGSFITHVSLLLVLAGGVVRVIWGQKGVLELREGQVVAGAVSEAGAMTIPFAVRLVDFDLEYHPEEGRSATDEGDVLVAHWPGTEVATNLAVKAGVTHVVAVPGGGAPLSVRIGQYLPDFFIDGATGEAGTRSPQPNNPALHVSVIGAGSTNVSWVFARFPEFSRHGAQGDGMAASLQLRFLSRAMIPGMGRMQRPVKAFRSAVELIEDGRVVVRKTIAVNAPLTYRGYTFYQLSYNPEDLSWTSLQVVRDPGVPIVYAGFVLMMVGMTVVFCIGPYLDDRQKQQAGGVA